MTSYPHRSNHAQVGSTSTPRDSNRAIVLIVGAALILWGIVALMCALNIPWLWWFDWDVFWPTLLIVAGAALIWRRTRGSP